MRGREIVRAVTTAVLRVKRVPHLTLPNPAFNSLLAVILTGPVVFQSVSAALQSSWAGYDPVRDAVSILVFGPLGWLQTAAFWVFGFSLIALAVVLYFHIKLKFRLGIFALVLLGAAFAVVGANPTGLPGVKDTLTAVTHRGATAFIVLAFPTVCFLLVPMLKAKRHVVLRWSTIAAGVFAVLFLTLGGIFLVNQLSLLGLYERVLLGCGQLWVEIVCAQLIIDRLRKKREPETVPD